MQKEGGFVNDPADRGGATKFGITRATLSRHLGRRASVSDVKKLDENTARSIIKDTYYHKPKIDQLPITLQNQLLDMAVNHGPRNAIKMLQRELKVKADGIIGKKTVAAARKMDGVKLNNAIVARRKTFYNNIVKRRPSQRKFLRGWLRRADSFTQ